jgi:hypothetical protein
MFYLDLGDRAKGNGGPDRRGEWLSIRVGRVNFRYSVDFRRRPHPRLLSLRRSEIAIVVIFSPHDNAVARTKIRSANRPKDSSCDPLCPRQASCALCLDASRTEHPSRKRQGRPGHRRLCAFPWQGAVASCSGNGEAVLD